MPRPPRPRHMGIEAVLAAKIRAERLARWWSLDDLSKRMAEAGCPVLPSGIHKTEAPGEGPRRRITLDEAAAYCRVLNISLEELTSEGVTSSSPRDRLREQMAAALKNAPDRIKEFKRQGYSVESYWLAEADVAIAVVRDFLAESFGGAA